MAFSWRVRNGDHCYKDTKSPAFCHRMMAGPRTFCPHGHSPRWGIRCASRGMGDAFLGALWSAHMGEMWPVSQGRGQERNCHLLNADLEGAGPRGLLHEEHKMGNACF